MTIQRLLTDNGSAFRSRAFAALCHELGIKHRFTRPYRPQTNGKAERLGQAGLADASSRPTVSPRAIAPAKALAIVELRRKRLTQARIAQALGVSASTVSRVLARAGLSHLADLEPAEPVVRYEHQAPGDLLHIDIKKLGRIQRPGHRVTGNRRDTVEGAGWDFVFVRSALPLVCGR
ncbi:homeodomain-like domain protein [Bordetella pertussis H934]|nr:homeodomain-like domain protein [Bordetella pertussis H934]